MIELSFSSLKGRWRRLKEVDTEVELIPHVIVGPCVLHNVCLLHGEEDFEDFIAKGMPNQDKNDEYDLPPDFHPPLEVEVKRMKILANGIF